MFPVRRQSAEHQTGGRPTCPARATSAPHARHFTIFGVAHVVITSPPFPAWRNSTRRQAEPSAQGVHLRNRPELLTPGGHRPVTTSDGGKPRTSGPRLLLGERGEQP